MRLLWLPAAHDAAIFGEQGRVCRIVAGETGKAIEHFHDGKWIAHEVEHLGREQVDDLGLDVTAACVEFGEQALRMSLDVAFVFLEQKLEIKPQAAVARHIEAEQIEQRQVAADRPAVRAFKREGVVLPIDDLERVDTLISGVGLGVQGIEPLLPLGQEMLVACVIGPHETFPNGPTIRYRHPDRRLRGR